MSALPPVPPAMLTVVVPVRNDARRLDTCLKSLRAEPGGQRVVVIVADNGSTDDSPGVARENGATCLSMPGLSVAQMRNRAVAQVATPLVALVDADHVLQPGWLACCLSLMADPTIGAGGAPYLTPTPGTWVQRAYDRFRSRPVGTTETDWLGSGNLVIRKEHFVRVGGFDETLETCEDVDLCNRLRQAGVRLVADPGMRSVHLGDPATLRQLFFSELWRGRDNIRVTLRGPLTLRALPSLVIPVVLLSLFVLAAAGVAVAAIDARGLWVPVIAGLALAAATALRTARMVAAGTGPIAIGEWAAVAAVYETARACALFARATHKTRREVGEGRG